MKKTLLSTVMAASALSLSMATPSLADSPSTSEPINDRITELEDQNKKLADELEAIKKLLKESAIVSLPDSQENPVSASASYKALVLKPTFDFAQTYAASDVSGSSGATNQLYDLEFDYSYAYELGLDFQAANSPWGAKVTFRNLEVDDTGRCYYDSEEDKDCGSTIAHGNEEYGPANDDDEYIKGTNDFNYNDLELLATYDPKDVGAIDWKFFAGIRSVNIGRSLTTDQFDPGGDDTGSTKSSSSYNGIGPAFAVKASKEIFTKNLNLYGKARIALLNGTTKAKFLEIPDAFSSPECEPSGFDDCTDSQVSQSGWNPTYGISIGLNYKWEISDDFSINFDAAYDFDKFMDVIGDTQYPDDVQDFSSRTTFSDLTLSGASLGIKATYVF